MGGQQEQRPSQQNSLDHFHYLLNDANKDDNEEGYFTNAPPHIQWAWIEIYISVTELRAGCNGQCKCQHYHLEDVEQHTPPVQGGKTLGTVCGGHKCLASVAVSV